MGIDSQGRYDVTTLTERVRRLANAYQGTLDTNGSEQPTSPPPIENQNISNQDILEQLNSSLMSAYSALIQDTQNLFVKVLYQDITANQIVYALPAGTIQLISVKIKPSSVQLNSDIRPDQWTPLYEYEEDNIDDFDPSGNGGLTFRRDDDTIVFSQLPAQDNPSGMQMRLVQLPQALVKPTDVCTTSLARFIQEFIIYDAAYVLCDTREKAVPESVSKGRDEWHERLIRAAENMNHPRFTQFKSSRMVKNSYTGR